MADNFNILDGANQAPMFGVVATGDPRTATAITTFSGANRCLFSRVGASGLISKIATDIGVSSGNISVAVYRNSGNGRDAVPTERVATSGAIASPGTGYQEIALTAPVWVNEGDWFAFSADNTTITVLRNNPASPTALNNGFCFRQDTAHPAPATAETLTTVTTSAPLLIGVK